MDIILLVLAILALLTGIIGSVLPLLPGPPVSWIGLLLLHFTDYTEFSTSFLMITGGVTVILAVLDYWLPTWSTKRFGGNKWAQNGATLGTIAGLFLGPFGVIIGSFVGAFIGAFINHPKDLKKVFSIAWGAFVGFLLGVGLKLIWCLCLLWWFVAALV